jgi:rfaE bifunctional protein kinase chain/domain
LSHRALNIERKFMDSSVLAAKRVLVVGDCMLDQYWFGDAERISPEAPVPVVRVLRTDARLGGAANVALNITTLGAKAALMSVAGEDEAGHTLRSLLEASGIESLLQTDSSIKTTVKLRIIARQQQMLRADFEDAPTREVLAAILGSFNDQIERSDAVVLSDYGKGGLNHIRQMIEHARQVGVPVLIDPKGSDYSATRAPLSSRPTVQSLLWLPDVGRPKKSCVTRRNAFAKSLI